ncbi:nicotinate-nucleotide--dimethylbenzimidazole phosphoribosyltransferase [Nitratireductor indicus]|uniref:nicotinate-nucleotide--dimethylbenzimidazole phosphoribosyltransferase n=1 Tax=Nitratireductor indicus TaxID=721133 RepID=UPI002875F31F|nr:nicotinate-nucleotide--dimethylbenzimidazole phosphoribosyltransferase [Nitratireductor indicus]MDS1135434.1 nicotinate-nucleotide--dimethylbenzimidazole phosphoribosyltransferase [Nitratireductor indicus]
MSVSGMPFDDVRDLLRELKAPDRTDSVRMAEAFARAGYGGNGLGRMKDLALWLAATRGRVPPMVGKAGIALYASTHGLFLPGADPLAAQRARVDSVAAGAAAVSHLCVANDLALNVFDLALDLPSGDITVEDALDERACAATIAFGMEATAEGGDLLCVGAVGEQSKVAALAVLCALHGEKAEALGSDAAKIVQAALQSHDGHLDDPLEVLRRLGGRDIAALTGAILAARAQQIPVVLEGLPALAAAAVLHKMSAGSITHCMLAGAGSSAEAQAASRLGLASVIDLGIAEGEGCASAMAAGVLKSAAILAGGAAEIARRVS